MGETRTAVVIDQWELVARGISSVLEEHGYVAVESFADAQQGIRSAREKKADLVVIGATGRGFPSEAATHAVRLQPRPVVLALAGGGDPAELGNLISAGVNALLVRSASSEELGDAVRRMERGERYVSPALLSSLVGAFEPTPATDGDLVLSAREREVLGCLARGRSNREIAHDLFVGVETVKSHLSRLYAKLDATDRHDCVARAVAAGLLG